ncbi:MAG TPA: glycoside hydrolase family 3 N-terminal domain-containing protein [Acidobacteriota bacterium]|nr:glycoside hydrolase family 3 N-terminal domain-containing protein [Acidobacteriota bacterium]
MQGIGMKDRLSRRAFLASSLAAIGGARGALGAIRRPASPVPLPFPHLSASLDERLGRMLMAGFRGLKLERDNPIVADIRERRIGGVVLFDYDVPSKSDVRNIESPKQVKALIKDLRTVAPGPLLVAVDQEGGRVARLKEKFGFPPSVSAKSLGALDDVAATGKAARTTAETLAEAGFDLNFAPVVDLDVNPANPVIGGLERSFSADPGGVTRHAAEVVRAHRDCGVLTCLKHFPGHGSSRADSHIGFTDVTETWSRKELEPYARLIDAGLCDSVMTAHIFNAALDPDLPATLSAKVVTRLLREGLAFDGPVISDDMQMKAISANYGFEDAVLKAVAAGVDILVFANNSVFDPGVAIRAHAVIKKAVLGGIIPEDRIGVRS